MNQTRVVNLHGNWAQRYSPGFVYIGRGVGGFARSKWANPYRIGKTCTREQSIEKYRKRLQGKPDLLAALPELRGKLLGCWCYPLPCHGNVLAELADAEPS